jgi:plasmid stabilization system protein ParE
VLPVIFHELAVSELNEASAYYAQARRGLGEAFIVEDEHAVAALAASPHAGTEVENDVRWWLVKRFPYSVLYRTHDDQIRVLAIAHQSRRPYYWRGRR